MSEEPIVSFEPGAGFSLVGIDLIVDDEDFAGVHIAVENLTKDFEKVTGKSDNAKVNLSTSRAESKNCVLIGSLTQSPTLQSLKDADKLDISKIEGKWESWVTVCISKPFANYDNALVIAGSDKRGAIFGAYSLSQQIGVSP